MDFRTDNGLPIPLWSKKIKVGTILHIFERDTLRHSPKMQYFCIRKTKTSVLC